jgi:hypothetical protein
VRWVSVVAGLAVIGVAAIAATRVENSRAGLIAEVITYLGGLVGLILLFYGVYARRGRSSAVRSEPSESTAPEPKVRAANDLLLGALGIILAIFLLSGLAMSGGMVWAAFGFILLLPMLAGSFYLGLRFLRAPARDWRVGLGPFRKAANQKKDAKPDQHRGPDHIPVDQAQAVGEKDQTNHDEDQSQGH